MRRRATPTGRRARQRAGGLLLAVAAMATASCIAEAEWTPQDVAPVVAPLDDRVLIEDVACPAAGACVAVGSLATVPSGTEALVLRQAGDGWDRVPVPLPLTTLRSVSCSASDACVLPGAVPLAYDGHQVTLLPPVPGDDADDPMAVDCVPGGACLFANGRTSAWWDGATWSVPVAPPQGMTRTDPQLSCTSSTTCLLVTTDFGIEGWPTPATVTSSTWNGATWSPVVTLDHATRVLDLDCATATTCFGTAGVRADYWTGPLQGLPSEVLRWDGAGWTVETIAYPGGVAPTEPGSVSCSSPTACTVLSVAGRSVPASPTVLARWTGAGWSAGPTTAAAAITALGCPSPNDCTATGHDVAERFDGTVWSATGLPSGTSPGETFGAVSCAADDDCVAVGNGWTLRTPSEGPLFTPTAQHFDGDEWADEDPGVALAHVSCGAVGSCMAAGSEWGTVWTRHRVGGAWRALPDLSEPGIGGVSGLSCPSASWCLLTTSAYGGAGDRAWAWTGGSGWSEVAALPAGTGTVAGVSCAAPEVCVAVSSWIGPAAHRLTGGSWQAVPLDGLGLDPLARLDDVACTAVDECVVVGNTGYVDGVSQGLLGVLGDDGWTATTRPGSVVIDVECWSGDGCAAVTTAYGPAGLAAGHLEVWDGERWRRVAGPSGVAHPVAVSCGAPERCEVVGGFVDGDVRAAVAAVTIDS